MKYWPLSQIASSPLMSPHYASELRRIVAHPWLSEGAMRACSAIARDLETPITTLVTIESLGTPTRRVYIDYPEFEDWFRLERAGFVASEAGFCLVIDALH